MTKIQSAFAAMVLISMLPGVASGNFGFLREPGGQAIARVNSRANVGGGLDQDLPPDELDDVFSVNSSEARDSVTNSDDFAFAQSSSEASISVATGTVGIAPTLNISAVYQVSGSNVELGRGIYAQAGATPTASATFTVTDTDAVEGTRGFFEGTIGVVAVGNDAPGLEIPINVSTSITIEGNSYSISAIRSGGLNPSFAITTTTPTGTATFESPGLNHSLFIRAPIALGDSVNFQTSIGGAGFLSGTIPEGANQTIQGQWAANAFASGYADDLIGDFDDNNAVDGDDLNLWETSFGQQVSAGTGADANGGGKIDGTDFLIWQRHVGETPSVVTTANASVPEPSSMMLIVSGAILVCIATRRIKMAA